MSNAVASTGVSQEAFHAFLGARGEPARRLEMRRDGWRRFQELPMPSVRDEEWMRTDIRLFKFDRFRLPEGSPSNVSAEGYLPHGLLAEGVELGGQVATSDSRPVQAELAEKWSD